jgi:hypothetical protein
MILLDLRSPCLLAAARLDEWPGQGTGRHLRDPVHADRAINVIVLPQPLIRKCF